MQDLLFELCFLLFAVQTGFLIIFAESKKIKIGLLHTVQNIFVFINTERVKDADF